MAKKPTPQPSPGTSTINFRVDAEVKEAARRAAKADSRNLSSLAKKALQDWLVTNGWLEPESSPRDKRLRKKP